MTERTFYLGDRGKAALTRPGAPALHEVLEAANAPDGLRTERWHGDTLIIICGLADTGRVIAVMCEPTQYPDAFVIIYAGALRGRDLDDWRRHL